MPLDEDVTRLAKGKNLATGGDPDAEWPAAGATHLGRRR